MTTVGWSPQALSLWAKTGPESEDWLDLPRHLTDSAAIGGWLWRCWLAPGVAGWLEDELDLRGEGDVLGAWLAGVHDVGKASEVFEGQLMGDHTRLPFAERIRDVGLPLSGPAGPADSHPHSAVSHAALKRWLVGEGLTRSSRAAASLAEIAGAHHGLPATPAEVRRAESAARRQPSWAAVQDELIAGITDRLGAHDVLRRVLAVEPRAHHQMLLTGLVVMADWIASNPDLFPLLPAALLDEEARLADAVATLDLAGPARPRVLEADPAAAYRHAFAWPEGRRPWPVQAEILRAAEQMEGPGLLCVEAPMGVGKTEAALAAAQVMMRRTGRSGVIVAAPTMATSDALFRRVQVWAERNLEGDGPVSLVLAHSKAALNAEAAAMPRVGMGSQDIGRDEPHDRHQSVVAHQWLSGRKRGMLASIAVGTVDQVLFMALQSRHVMLRHLGLASKVVVIDEAHAYDSYMNQYLSRALHWLGAYGVPVVLLSATLPHAIQQELVAAYMDGRHGGRRITAPETGAAYPVITTADRAGIRAEQTPESGRRSEVEFTAVADDEDSLRELLTPCVSDGGCLLVVCSTVARAQHAYALARDLVGDDAVLLHSRFLARDRVEKEAVLVTELGPDARRGQGRPERRIVVATQVVEQSLDLDFDGMVTDVAPMDLILQRTGRVHRHARPVEDRPGWGRAPRVWVRGAVDPGDDATPPAFESGVEAVYAPALLTATWGLLSLERDGRTVSLPREIPTLVAGAYAERPALPEAWGESFVVQRKEWEARQETARNRAKGFLLPTAKGVKYFRDLWAGPTGDPGTERGEAAGLAQVRDTDPTLEVLLVRAAEGGYVPWGSPGDAEVTFTGKAPSPWRARQIAESSVRLPGRFSRMPLFERALDELEQGTDVAWQQCSLLRGQLQLIADEEGRTTVAGVDLRYDPDLGLLDGPQTTRMNEGTR